MSHLMLGPHMRLQETPAATLSTASSLGYGVFQTGWGNMTSLGLAERVLNQEASKFPRTYDLEKDPKWVIHSAYSAHAAPKDHKTTFAVSEYLKVLFSVAQAVGSTYIVLHTGATKDKTPQEVADKMRKFLEIWVLPNLEAINQDYPLQLMIENVAAAYPYNQDLTYTVKAIEGLPHISWCLDLAHRWAAGVPNDELDVVLEKHPPGLCHANFPGSKFGCGLDRHSFRYQASQSGISAEDIQHWDKTVKFLYDKKVPLILEGSSFVGEMSQEVDCIRQLVSG